MLELTEQQNSVGSVLQEGQAMLQESELSAEDRQLVTAQMTLLNTRWEHLRLHAMDRQTRYDLPHLMLTSTLYYRLFILFHKICADLIRSITVTGFNIAYMLLNFFGNT